MLHELSPCAAIVWFSVLMSNNNDSNAGRNVPINDRVRKDSQRKRSTTFRGWRAETRMLDQALRNAFELTEKPSRDKRPGLLSVEVQRGAATSCSAKG